jgi:hypothetical protein
MGFDISFHPVHPSEVTVYLVEPLADPELLDERLLQLTRNSQHRESLRNNVFAKLPALTAVRQKRKAFNTTIGFAAAIVSGYLHPYWYSRGAALSFWVKQDPHVATLLSSLGAEVPGLSGLHDLGRLTGNDCSGAFVAPGQVGALEAHLKKAARDPALRGRWGDPEPLAQALKYAKQHGLGVLEATEIVDAGGTLSWPPNLRANHTRNLKKLANTASGCLKRATCKALIAVVREHWKDIEQGRFDVVLEPGWRLEPDMLALLARHCTSARLVLSGSIETPPELLVDMALGEPPAGETEIERGRVFVAAVENPSFPMPAMRRLLAETKKPSPGLLHGLAKNRSTPADILEQVLKFPRLPAARLAVAKHPNATPDMLSQLATDGLKETRVAARNHPRFRDDGKPSRANK